MADIFNPQIFACFGQYAIFQRKSGFLFDSFLKRFAESLSVLRMHDRGQSFFELGCAVSQFGFGVSVISNLLPAQIPVVKNLATGLDRSFITVHPLNQLGARLFSGGDVIH